MSIENSENILRQPIIHSSKEQASGVTVCIELFCADQNNNLVKCSSGSGFFHNRKEELYFITNWHVITGRNPSEPSKLINNHPDSPVAFQLHLPLKEDRNHYVPSEIMPLYAGSEALWLETESPNLNEKVDLAAIKLGGKDTFKQYFITPIEEFSPSGSDYLHVGRDTVIVGYPFGISELNPYPIWKRGYVASEPSLLIGGMPKYYIDCPGRPGMSGSPVFMITEGIKLPSDIANILNGASGESALESIGKIDPEVLKNVPKSQILHFAGVYSGSVGDSNLDRLQVGVTWHAAIVDRLFTHGVIGNNPYLPAAIEC